MTKVVVVLGTRPEAIKLAPVIRELRAQDGLETVVIATSQHREMLRQMTDFFGVEVDVDLDLMQDNQVLHDLTSRAMAGLSRELVANAPDLVVVQGDTTTSAVGALAAAYERTPVAHVEAGLRSHDRQNPFPEELNRRVISQLAQLHLAPTALNRANLLAEGVDERDVHVTGNTVIDALRWTIANGDASDLGVHQAALDGRRLLLVTAHRRESWESGIASVARALREIASRIDDVVVVLPVHRNPVVRSAIAPVLDGVANVVLTDPLAYGPFCHLMAHAHVVLTDSGGIQEEAPSLGVTVLVTRSVTERTEAVEAGTVRLVGTDEQTIIANVQELFDDPSAHQAMAQAVNPYGDGRAAARTVQAIRHLLEGGPAPDPFVPGSDGP
jgi:UDP-N-acetylglucosamine 2-epimerase (non-hydrolysing)